MAAALFSGKNFALRAHFLNINILRIYYYPKKLHYFAHVERGDDIRNDNQVGAYSFSSILMAAEVTSLYNVYNIYSRKKFFFLFP